eukprot:CAMPEP_0181251802 /NCGR_PEP_ID=MMETSP1096-20121128/47093_1 /TAXON_ID=156174 ORGANISM="Chrysochromulina ericina, Strain CCMP281" /NCGR_SAMPLE_ID=MMETSP1096 /ASSEMBLY_ACC=CAM_ASM_000453 /LENGTH=32 /DNA_ID= /DNA_START= /DNA_END= /DNA_ORIENTATION=
MVRLPVSSLAGCRPMAQCTARCADAGSPPLVP